MGLKKELVKKKVTFSFYKNIYECEEKKEEKESGIISEQKEKKWNRNEKKFVTKKKDKQKRGAISLSLKKKTKFNHSFFYNHLSFFPLKEKSKKRKEEDGSIFISLHSFSILA